MMLLRQQETNSCYVKKMKIISFIKNSFTEVRYKITWPFYKKLKNLLLCVFIGTALISCYLFFADEINKKIQEGIYGWLNQKS